MQQPVIWENQEFFGQQSIQPIAEHQQQQPNFQGQQQQQHHFQGQQQQYHQPPPWFGPQEQQHHFQGQQQQYHQPPPWFGPQEQQQQQQSSVPINHTGSIDFDSFDEAIKWIAYKNSFRYDFTWENNTKQLSSILQQQNQPLNAADAISILYNCVSNLREDINSFFKILHIVTSQPNGIKPQSKKRKMNQENVPSKKNKFDYGPPFSQMTPPSQCVPPNKTPKVSLQRAGVNVDYLLNDFASNQGLPDLSVPPPPISQKKKKIPKKLKMKCV
jgi:hypothetical protein